MPNGDSLGENGDTNQYSQADWLPEKAVESLKMERVLHNGEETDAQLSRRLMQEASPLIATGIIHTALHGATDRVRLDAQKYVLDRVLGKPGDDAYETVQSPLETLVTLLTKDAEEYANADHSGGDATG
jgi:hypothetical protein